SHVSRDLIVRILHSENVLARRYFYPGCHKMEPYRSYFPHVGMLLPITEGLVQRCLLLPNGTALGAQEIGTICGILRLCIKHGDELQSRLSSGAA
ncbi:MAG: dTDP-4-dehydro-6-deoxyglucose aminotransferase, partial [Desulfobacteraceae bacterium]